MRLLVLITLLGLSACGEGEPLPTCTGPIFALNTGRWQPIPADLQMPKPIGRGE